METIKLQNLLPVLPWKHIALASIGSIVAVCSASAAINIHFVLDGNYLQVEACGTLTVPSSPGEPVAGSVEDDFRNQIFIERGTQEGDPSYNVNFTTLLIGGSGAFEDLPLDVYDIPIVADSVSWNSEIFQSLCAPDGVAVNAGDLVCLQVSASADISEPRLVLGFTPSTYTLVGDTFYVEQSTTVRFDSSELAAGFFNGAVGMTAGDTTVSVKFTEAGDLVPVLTWEFSTVPEPSGYAGFGGLLLLCVACVVRRRRVTSTR